MAETDTTLRARPIQARARATFDAILDAAADLLDDVGWDGFNTNALAERAGQRVATVYRYFPNKLAVISALAERMVGEWDDWFAGFAPIVRETGDIKAAWAQYFDAYPDLLRRQPGGLALRRAMQASPALRAIDGADNRRLAAEVAPVLIDLYPTLPQEEAEATARVLMESAVALIDVMLDSPPAEAKRIAEATKAMHFAALDRLAAASR